MANIDVRRQMDQVLSRFVDEVMSVFLKGMPGDPTAKLPAAPKVGAKAAAALAKVSRRGPKSTPADVKVLIGKIQGVLGKATVPMSAADIHAVIKGDAGQFNYALGKLKAAGEVTQFGARRMACYQLRVAEKAPAGVRKAKGGKGAKAAKGAKGAKVAKV